MRANKSQQSSNYVDSNMKEPRKPYVKIIFLNFTPVTGLIDSGSSGVLLRASVARGASIDIRVTRRVHYTL